MVVAGGGVVAASGYVLLFPFYLTDVAGMQFAHLVHAVLSVPVRVHGQIVGTQSSIERMPVDNW